MPTERGEERPQGRAASHRSTKNTPGRLQGVRERGSSRLRPTPSSSVETRLGDALGAEPATGTV